MIGLTNAKLSIHHGMRIFRFLGWQLLHNLATTESGPLFYAIGLSRIRATLTTLRQKVLFLTFGERSVPEFRFSSSTNENFYESCRNFHDLP